MHSQVKEYEPGAALFHENPLEFYNKLIEYASASSAALFLECNDKTADRVEKLAVRKFSKVSLHNDLDGNPRFVIAKPDYQLPPGSSGRLKRASPVKNGCAIL